MIRPETNTIQTDLLIIVVALLSIVVGVHSFQSLHAGLSSSQALRSVALFSENNSSSENIRRKDQQEGEEFLFGSGDDLDYARTFPSDDQIFNSLNRKVKELELGIGKRYIIRTQRGFLNVHYEVRLFMFDRNFFLIESES